MRIAVTAGRLFLSVPLLVLWVACSNSGTSSTEPQQTGPTDAGALSDSGRLDDGGRTGPLCVPNAQRVAAHERCRKDDDCPCGTWCNAGLCLPECTSNAQCDGGVCDLFGRCRPAEDTTVVAPLTAPPANPAELRVSPRLITAPTGTDARDIILYAISDTLPRLDNVRVEVSDGLTVNCHLEQYQNEIPGFGADAGPVTAQTCAFPYFADSWRLEVVGTAPFESGEVRTVTVFAGGQQETISYVPPVALQPTEPPAAQPRQSTAGRFVGTAELVGVGLVVPEYLGSGGDGGLPYLDGLQPTNGAAPAAPMRLPVTFDVFATGDLSVYQFRLKDDLGVLSADGVLEGTLYNQNGGFQVQIDAREYLPGALRTVGPLRTGLRQRFVHQHRSPVTGTFASSIYWTKIDPDQFQSFTGALSFELEPAWDVLPLEQFNPRARWVINLTWVGDVPGGQTAPIATAGGVADSVIQVPAESVLAPTAWEEALWSKASPASAAKAVVQGYLNGGNNLAGCAQVGHPYQDALFSLRVASWWYALGWWGDVDADISNGSSSFQIIHSSPPDSPETHPLLKKAAQLISDDNAGARVQSIFANSIVRNVYSFVADRDVPGTSTTQDLTERELPCAISYSAMTLTGLPTVPAFTEDRCDEMAARLSCTPRTLSSTEQASNIISHEFVTPLSAVVEGAMSLVTPMPGDVNGTVTRVCRLEGVSPSCAESALCYSPGNNGASSLLAPSFSADTGDALCAGSERLFGVDADANPLQLTAGQMLNACFADLAALDASPLPGVPLDDALGSNGCVDVGRFLLALGGATDMLRHANLLPDSTAETVRAGRLAQRLFSRWVGLHAYLARETGQTALLAQILRRNPIAGDAVPIDPALALSASLRGWQVLLHPRFAAAVDAIPGVALLEPDYRDSNALPGGLPSDPQQPLPTSILKALWAQVELASHVVKDAQRVNNTDAARWTSEVLRRVVVLQSMAVRLEQRAQQACGLDCPNNRPVWFDSYSAAKSGLAVAVQRLVASTRALQRGDNPLGIEETDLPLYFLGGQVSDDSRFFAISDYLVGRSPGAQDSWAPSLVADAEHKLTAARAAWIERRDRALVAETDQQVREDRLSNILQDSGNVILELCGRPTGLLPSDVFQRWQQTHGYPFNPNDCAIDFGNMACVGDPYAYLRVMETPEARFATCMVREINAEHARGAHFASNAMTDFAAACADDQTSLTKNCSAPDTGACLVCNGGAAPQTPLPLGAALDVLVDDAVLATVVAGAQQTCAARYPAAKVPLPGVAATLPELPANCYRGAIGEQALALRSVSKEIEIARTELSELTESYDIAMKSCILRRTADATQTQMQQKHNKQMSTLRAVKLAADIAANVASGVKDCAGAMAGATAPWDKAAGGVACGAAAVEAAATSVSDGMQFAMDEADAEFDLKLQQAEAKAAYAICQNDARQNLVGSRSQALRIQRALADLDVANSAYRNLRAQADLAWDQGRADIDSERTRTLHPLSDDTWLDEKVQSFGASWKLAYRVTYLAVRAVEYEFQQSLALRTSALAAEIPSDLENVLRELRTYTGPRSIHGSRPSNKKAILSLRDQLVRLVDRTMLSADELRLSPAERLRLMLTSSKHAVYDKNGVYLGQRVPFTLSPVGFAPEGGTTFEIYSQDSCAERLWSVNASILGGPDMLRGSETTFTNMSVLKANTFSSQWCDDMGRNRSQQFASVRPERNLFRDPEGGSAGFVDAQLSALVGQTESRALIQPALNVARGEFEDDAYENGDSSQLAARGLYGEYAVFFPAQVLSRVVEGVRTDGLDLSQVDDILLRFDYVAAAR